VLLPEPARSRTRALAGGRAALVAAWQRRKPSVPRTAAVRVRAGLAAAGALLVAALAGAVYMLMPSPDGGTAAAVAAKPGLVRPPALPVHGILVSGQSLGGVHLGDTANTVRVLWGHKFTICEGCKPTTWFYFRTKGDPVGAGVTFRHGRVTGIYTLGMTHGWRTADGVKVGDILSSPALNDQGKWKLCAGYSAKSKRSSNAVTSILTVGPAVYGFSLTRPNESICH